MVKKKYIIFNNLRSPIIFIIIFNNYIFYEYFIINIIFIMFKLFYNTKCAYYFNNYWKYVVVNITDNK
jgi:hypothetical protein